MDGPLEPAQRHFVDIVHRNSQRLERLVNDILDFSRLEAHQVVLRPQPFCVRAVVDGIADWAVPFAQGRNLAVSFAVDESIPTSVVGDALRISQVVTNLVQNAIKFTELGGVEVKVCSRTAAPNPDGTPGPDLWVDFTITDTGVGIAEDHLHALHEPFTQADATATRGYEGVGLGLAICRDLADLMDGHLHTTSTLGEGSRFTFSVPLTHAGEDNG